MAEHFDDLLEVLKARVQLLMPLVNRVVAVLQEEQNTVDRQTAGTKHQGLRDRLVALEAIGHGQTLTDVGTVYLIHVQRRDVTGGRVESLPDPVTFEKPRDKIVGV